MSSPSFVREFYRRRHSEAILIRTCPAPRTRKGDCASRNAGVDGITGVDMCLRVCVEETSMDSTRISCVLSPTIRRSLRRLRFPLRGERLRRILALCSNGRDALGLWRRLEPTCRCLGATACPADAASISSRTSWQRLPVRVSSFTGDGTTELAAEGARRRCTCDSAEAGADRGSVACASNCHRDGAQYVDPLLTP